MLASKQRKTQFSHAHISSELFVKIGLSCTYDHESSILLLLSWSYDNLIFTKNFYGYTIVYSMSQVLRYVVQAWEGRTGLSSSHNVIPTERNESLGLLLILKGRRQGEVGPMFWPWASQTWHRFPHCYKGTEIPKHVWPRESTCNIESQSDGQSQCSVRATAHRPQAGCANEQSFDFDQV